MQEIPYPVSVSAEQAQAGQDREIGYALALSNLRSGWTVEQRRA